MMMPRRLALAAILLGSSGLPASPAESPKDGDFRILKRVKVGGEGGWDYLTVDPEAKRLYLSHSTQTEVVDLDKDAVVGKVANTAGVHGIAVARDLGRGFTSNGRAGAVTVFDLKTLEPVGTVAVGSRLFSVCGNAVMAFSDAKAGKLIMTVPIGKGADGVAFDPDAKLAFSSNGEGTITVVHEDSPDKVSVVQTLPTQRGARTIA